MTTRVTLPSGTIGLLLAVAYLGLNLSFLTANYSYDAVAYAVQVHRALFGEIGSYFWHEYHILYMPVAFLIAKTSLVLGSFVDVIVLMQLFNAVVSALTLWVFYILLQRELRDMTLSALLTALLGFSYCFWYYSTNPDWSQWNIYIIVDPAGEKKKSNDFTVMAVLGLAPDGNTYLLAGIRDRLNLTERTKTLFGLVRE